MTAPAQSLTFIHVTLPSGEHNLVAWWHGHPAGILIWWVDGETDSIEVAPEWRRRGIATALWRRAKLITPELRHSASQTADGKAWAVVTP